MKEQPHICPLCGRAYDEPPALSRVDNQTDICPRCGMMEALGGHAEAGNATGADAAGRVRHGQPLGDRKL